MPHISIIIFTFLNIAAVTESSLYWQLYSQKNVHNYHGASFWCTVCLLTAFFLLSRAFYRHLWNRIIIYYLYCVHTAALTLPVPWRYLLLYPKEWQGVGSFLFVFNIYFGVYNLLDNAVMIAKSSSQISGNTRIKVAQTTIIWLTFICALWFIVVRLHVH